MAKVESKIASKEFVVDLADGPPLVTKCRTMLAWGVARLPVLVGCRLEQLDGLSQNGLSHVCMYVYL